MLNAKTEKYTVEFPTQLRVPEKLAILADKRGQSVSVVLRRLIDDALSEYGMTLYDTRIRRGDAHSGAANEGTTSITVKLTNAENDMLMQAVQDSGSYGPSDYIVLLLDRNYDKYKLRHAYQDFLKVEKQRRDAKVARNIAIIIMVNPQRYERYRCRAEKELHCSLNNYILTLLYYDNKTEDLKG